MKLYYLLLAGTLLMLAGCKKDDPEPLLPTVTITGTYELGIGEPLGTLTPTGAAACNGQPVAGMLVWKASATVYDAVGQYDAAWVFIPEDIKTYAPVEGSVNVTVVTYTGKQVIYRFKMKMYNHLGQVNANHLESDPPTEWNLVATSPSEVLPLFTFLTGVPAPLTERYDYTYRSSDGKCTIRIVGTTELVNYKYATMYVQIDECPEITLLHLVDMKFLSQKKNGKTADRITAYGIPVKND